MSFIRPSQTVLGRPDLALVAAGYSSKFYNFLADRLLPPVLVQSETGVYFNMPADALAGMSENRRNASSAFNRISRKASASPYYTREFGLEEAIDRTDKKRYPGGIVSEQASVDLVMEQMKKAREKRVAGLLINETNFPASGTTGLTVSTKWDAVASTPASDLQTCADNIRNATGVPKPFQTLVVSRYTLDHLAFVTDVRNMLKVSQSPFAGQISADMAAVYFGVKEVLVGDAMYLSSSDDVATPVLSDIWTKTYAFLCVPMIDPAVNTTRQPGLGATFRWDVQGAGYIVETYGEDPVDSDIVRVREFADEKIINSGYGNLLNTVA